MKRILITGGAGFVGSSLAVCFRQTQPEASVVAFDNLRRRGSELILGRLRAAGVEFVHGDVRIREDLFTVGEVDLIVDCAAEPSVLAGQDGAPDYVVQTNLVGTTHCLELARRHGAAVVFLSTSRVYPFGAINSLAYRETATRFEFADEQTLPGASRYGIAEEFPLTGPRSLYGASKLASELLLQEYAEAYGVRVIVNRCGVLTGPWQMGRVDQGVMVLWAARHVFERGLTYLGFGGEGKQVRDVLHVRDLFSLLQLQLARLDEFAGETFNVGGGLGRSVSLCELTDLCQRVSGRRVPISADAATRRQDVISYVTDHRRVSARTGWQPRLTVEAMVEEITRWIVDNRAALEPVLA